MLSDTLKSYLIASDFSWDGNRCFSKDYELKVKRNQTVIVNSRIIEQPPQLVQVTLLVEDYGPCTVSDVDETNCQQFNFVSFKRKISDGRNPATGDEDEWVDSFFESEEEALSDFIQRFLKKAVPLNFTFG